MITFKQFITEQQQFFSFEDGLKQIKANCKFFLSESDGVPLYRGMGQQVEGVSWTPHPKNRPPRDSEPEFNFFVNSMFDAAFGIENIRRISFFATGNMWQAENYGKVMFCFPAGKIRWMWSPDINDLFEDQLKVFRQVIQTAELSNLNPRVLANIFDNLYSRYKSSPHTWVYDLEDDADEVTLRATRTATVDHKIYFGEASPYNIIHAGLIGAAKDLYRDSTALKEAIESGNEIMVYESEGYYLINAETVVNAAIDDGFDVSKSTSTWRHAYEYLLQKLT